MRGWAILIGVIELEGQSPWMQPENQLPRSGLYPWFNAVAIDRNQISVNRIGSERGMI